MKQRWNVTESGCWEWIGAHDNTGYGRIRIKGRLELAHRWVYERHVGEIPDGLHIDHLCRNRCCVNPDHLEPVTQAENNRRGTGWAGENARKTHCLHGHPLSGGNMRLYRGHRICLLCERNRRRQWRARLKQAS